MKKIIILIQLPALMALLLLFSPQTGLLAKKQLGKINFLKGQVDIIDTELRSRHTPVTGEAIYLNNEIRTGAATYLELLLTNGEELTIYPRSVVNIDEEKIDSINKKIVRLLTGEMRIHLPRKLGPTQRFILKTPTAIAGVQGTDFGVIASLSETRILVFSGHVLAANRSKMFHNSYNLYPRSEIKIISEREPFPPRVLPTETLDTWFDSYFIDPSGTIQKRYREPDHLLDKLIKKKKLH